MQNATAASSKRAKRQILEIKLSVPGQDGLTKTVVQHPTDPIFLKRNEEVVVRNGIIKIRCKNTHKVRRVMGSNDPDTHVIDVDVGVVH